MERLWFFIGLYRKDIKKFLSQTLGILPLLVIPFQFPSVIDLNVGGHRFTTHLSTLTKEPDSMLAKMFSGRQSATKDKDGFYFLDADGEVFQHILNFLRNEEKPPRSVSERVKHLAAYFGIQTLVYDLNKVSTEVRNGADVPLRVAPYHLLTETRVRKRVK